MRDSVALGVLAFRFVALRVLALRFAALGPVACAAAAGATGRLDLLALAVRGLAVTALALGVACTREDPRARSQEFAHLSQAIDRVRDVPNDRKQKPLAHLRSLGCQHYCALQKECIDAYEVHLAALDGVEQARSLASRDPDAASALLSRARLRLGDAHRRTTACAAHQGEAERARK